jgi:hypothetical protein
MEINGQYHSAKIHSTMLEVVHLLSHYSQLGESSSSVLTFLSYISLMAISNSSRFIPIFAEIAIIGRSTCLCRCGKLTYEREKYVSVRYQMSTKNYRLSQHYNQSYGPIHLKSNCSDLSYMKNNLYNNSGH